MGRESLGGSSDLPEGNVKGVNVGIKYLLGARVEGELYAIDGKCSHMVSDLARGRLDGHLVTCRLYGAQFNIRSGMRLQNMAASSLTAYKVTEEDWAGLHGDPRIAIIEGHGKSLIS